MEDCAELIVPDNLDNSDVEHIFPDFSQVQIQVHGRDVAEKIIEDIADLTEDNDVVYTEEYLDTDNYSEEITNDYLGQEESAFTVNYNENILSENNSNEFTNIVDVNTTEADSYEDSDLDNMDMIPEKDISKYEAVIEEYPDYANMHIKEEIEPFIGTDYTDFDAGPMETDGGNDLPPEDIYHCNNVIILGSKPCPNTSKSILRRLLNEHDSIDEVRKENLNATVLLEDWGDHLRTSQSFCKECGTLFVTPNALDAHNMTAHSFLVPISKSVAIKSTAKPAISRKSTGTLVKSKKNLNGKGPESFDKFCHHCSKMFPDRQTLIKHLYEMLPKQFSCNICKAAFLSQRGLTNHITALHVKREKGTVKKEKTDKKGAHSKSKPLPESKKKCSAADSIAIPKSVLFLCTKCGSHFLSTFSGLCHSKSCDPSSTSRKKPAVCEVCKRKIHPRDKNLHKKQHKICSKFRVIPVHKDLVERTLCKCPNCHVHFSTDFAMNIHLKDCGKIKTLQCQICKISLPKSRYHLHMQKHKLQNLKHSDFITIQYSVQRCAVKRKLQAPITPSKRIKLEYSDLKNNTKKNLQTVKIKEPQSNKIAEVKLAQKRSRGTLERDGHKFRMYFCANCKGCCFLHAHRIIHLNKQCSLTDYANVICSDCGLLFSRTAIRYHRNLHKNEFAINDVAFFDVYTLKRTVPSIPDYPQCSKCKIKFFGAKLLADHICGEDYQTCNICGDNYHNSAYDAHLNFHTLIQSKSTPKVQKKVIPELMKKYQSLNTMWNIVYGCMTCDIITDQYDKAVEHSQGHLNHKIITKNIKCYICNLKFQENCWSKHSELHSRMNINNKDFNVLRYNPKKLLTEEWFELFHSLPKELIRQITEKSVYGSERRFEMKLLKEGRSEFTVYCCSVCEVCCQSNEIENHINSPCKNSTNICKICSIPFYDISTLRNHQILHLKGIKKEEFRVVVFTKQQTTYNPKQQTKTKPKQAKLKQLQPRLLTKRKKTANVKAHKFANDTYKGVAIDKNGKYILYRCRNCKNCIHFNRNIPNHNCITSTRADQCVHCNEYFNVNNINSHVKRHLEQPDFRKDNFVIKLFNNNNSKNVTMPKKKRKIVNSKGKPNKGKGVSLEKKVFKRPKNTVASQNASNVNEAELPSTPSVNVASPSTSSVNIAESPIPSTGNKMATVYKCDCGLHYTSLTTIEKHIQTCDTQAVISKEHCSKCGLLFPTNVLVSHLCKHHSKNSQFIVESYKKQHYAEQTVESTSGSPVPVANKKTQLDCDIVLYKCGDCNVYYINQNTCYKHVYKYHRKADPNHIIECNFCSLRFMTQTISNHCRRHHSDTLNLDKVWVEEYHPPKEEGPPRVERYIAADRVESFQVTSSIDEC